jgi:tripeptide aminopeptidase
MDLDRMIECTLAIQAIPAPTFEEGARAEFLRARFGEASVQDVAIDEVGNLLGRTPGGALTPVVVAAHLDSVFPSGTDLRATRREAQLVGPGIGDNAVGLAGLVELALDFRERPPAGDVWLVATTGEEGLGNLRGIRAVVDRFGAEVSAYLIVEGMAFGHIYARGLPVRRFRIAVQTTGGHAWVHAGRPSAIHQLISIGADLTRVPLPRNPRTSLNIGRMAGGTTINSIASNAWMEVDLRCELAAALDMLAEHLRRLAGSHASPVVQVTVDDIGARPGAALPAGHPLLRAAQEALLEAGESPPEPETASTDATYPLSRGLPAVCVGLTRGSGAHSLEEQIEIGPIPRGYDALVRLIDKAQHFAPPGHVS